MQSSADYSPPPSKPPMEIHYQVTENLRYPSYKGYKADTPFRVDEELEKNEGTKGKKCLEAFIRKGGAFYHLDPNFLKEEDRLVLLPGDIVFPSCSAGFNRSQTLYVLLSHYETSITLMPPHATRLGFDPFNDKVNWHKNKVKEREPDEFALWASQEKGTRQDKLPRFGFDHFNSLIDEQNPSPEALQAIRKYFDVAYFGPDSIPDRAKNCRRVYITFAQNAHVILNRLNQTNADLNQVVVVSIDLDDYIDKPLEKNVIRKSQASYAIFANILRDLIDFSRIR